MSFTGWQGWSVDFVIPLAILVNMLSMVIISAAGKMEVAEYLFYLVQAGACGLIPFILLIAGAVSGALSFCHMFRRQPAFSAGTCAL